MRLFADIKKFEENNTRFLNTLNHFLAKKDLVLVKRLLMSVSEFSVDGRLQDTLTDLFINKNYCNELFGIAGDIVNTMGDIVFSGNVNIKTPKSNANKELERLLYDGLFIRMLKEAYVEAITAYDHKSYVLMMFDKIIDEETHEKVGNTLANFKVLKSFEVEHYGNTLKWNIYKEIDKPVKKDKLYQVGKFVYEYKTIDGRTYLTIRGYCEDGAELTPQEVMEFLEIESLNDEFDFKPYYRLDVEKSMLPKILRIEDKLAQAIYFQNEDLSNSQTQMYTPENMLYNVGNDKNSYFDDYKDQVKTKHTLRGGASDGDKIEIVEGKSSIDFIEKNMAMLILEACLDGGISSLSLGHLLVDKFGNNTDVGESKERVTIRKRNSHVNVLKIFIAELIKDYLKEKGHNVDKEDITVIFDPYITPSVETMTNVLSKQVQFGIKSREQAVQDLNKNELSDNEIQKEIENIKEFTTQQDFNSVQQIKAGSDNQKQDKDKDTTKLKVDNNLKSSGIEE